VFALLPGCTSTWKGLSDDASSLFGEEEEETEEVRVEQVREVVSMAELQQLLDEQGYDPGPVDGVFGDRTARAIRSYQVNNGLKVTGRPSADLVERLRATSGAPSEPLPE
jgi:peptidoglycan hydrolase-like protein with peptidoglycan-binding domain